MIQVYEGNGELPPRTLPPGRWGVAMVVHGRHRWYCGGGVGVIQVHEHHGLAVWTTQEEAERLAQDLSAMGYMARASDAPCVFQR